MYRSGFNYDVHRPDLDLVERKKRQQLRESNVEIRELEAKLRQGYINKAVAVQIEERKQQKVKDLEEKKLEAQQLEYHRTRAIEEERLEDQRDKVERLKLSRCLDNQIEYKREEEIKSYEQFLREKRAIDEIIAKVKEEERAKSIAALKKKTALAETIKEFVEAQKYWVVLEKERNNKENRDIVNFIAKKEAWKKEQDALAIERRKVKNDSVIRLAESLDQKRRDEDERSRLLHELHEGRVKEQEIQLDQQEIEREIKRKLNLRESNALAIEAKRRQQEKDKLDEEAWKQRLMEQYEKDAKLEQLSDHKRRMMKLQWRREAERLADERRQRREKERAAEKEYWRQHLEEEKAKDAIIERERNRLLREHAKKLIGFLPSGILREKDLEMLADDDFTLLYKPRVAPDPLVKLEEYYEELNKKKVSPFEQEKTKHL